MVGVAQGAGGFSPACVLEDAGPINLGVVRLTCRAGVVDTGGAVVGAATAVDRTKVALE